MLWVGVAGWISSGSFPPIRKPAATNPEGIHRRATVRSAS